MPQKKTPIRDKNESAVDFIERAGLEQERYNKSLLRAIDAVPGQSETRTTDRPKPKEEYSFIKAGSVHDYLADNPRLLKRYKEIGPAALLEME